MTAARREQPDICLIDIRMPGGGIRATAKIVSALPDTTVVMYTHLLDPEEAWSGVHGITA